MGWKPLLIPTVQYCSVVFERFQFRGREDLETPLKPLGAILIYGVQGVSGWAFNRFGLYGAERLGVLVSWRLGLLNAR